MRGYLECVSRSCLQVLGNKVGYYWLTWLTCSIVDHLFWGGDCVQNPPYVLTHLTLNPMGEIEINHNLKYAMGCIHQSARQQFGNLQHKTFPIYFIISIILGSGLATLWTWSHPDVTSHLAQPYLADVAQLYALGTVLLGQSFNYFVIGPLTSKYVVRTALRRWY